MRVPAFAQLIWSLAAGGLVLGCGGAGSIQSAGDAPPVVGSVRLFVGSDDVSPHLALGEGQTLRIEVRLYAANGDRILPTEGEVQVTFLPSTFATATPVPDAPLFKDVKATAVRDTPGGIYVRCDQTKIICTRQFGPFDSLIH